VSTTKEQVADWLGRRHELPKKRSSAAGKGDHRRPPSVNSEEFAKNWERTFGKGES
jgi:hypothetical protein